MSSTVELSTANQHNLTDLLARRASGMSMSEIPSAAVTVAKHCILDWIGVALAGHNEPLAMILREHVRDEGGIPRSTLLGSGDAVTVAQATLVNGSTSHALDYDDVLWPMRGHPTVAVAPVVFALGERLGCSGATVLESFVAGVETACRVGILMGDDHYAQGWHATGTVGTFGAAASASRLLNLDPSATATALGIAGTQAAGLRAMFGTMCKPFHAGKAGVNGLFAAQLAARGFTGTDDILGCKMGFSDTQTNTPSFEEAIADLDHFFLPSTFFKHHAACYGTHAPIEAARKIGSRVDFTAESVQSVEVTVPGRLLNICDIQNPASELEGKFSFRYTVALALLGIDTASPGEFTMRNIEDPVVKSMMKKVRVLADDGLQRFASTVAVTFHDNSVQQTTADMGTPMADLDAQWDRLAAKFAVLAEPIIGGARTTKVLDACHQLESLESVMPIVRNAVRPA